MWPSRSTRISGSRWTSARTAPTALAAYVALRKLNVLMFKGMTPKQRTRVFTHPEFGALTPEWVAAQLAGHDIHHLKQLRQIK